MADEQVVAKKSSDGRKITFEVSLVAIGSVVLAALAGLYWQVRELEKSVSAVLVEQAAIKGEMNALKESARDLKGELDRLAPRAFIMPPPVSEAVPSSRPPGSAP